MGLSFLDIFLFLILEPPLTAGQDSLTATAIGNRK